MSAIWITIIALALGTAALKLVGPLLLGGRSLPAQAMGVIELLASALLAALVVVETFGHGRALTVDARAIGVAFAAIALVLRAPVTVAVLGAAVAAALVRAIS
ncbi:MAG: AzlD domain-containing protein [Solirubrobacterales bacterium]|nr:AzlD domain-containing protein [Solirubrobacterales bacterium]MBV9366640.1 AzlD domain-containing protein [Solirubrobacterales bacterium]MBV9684311.1 AzlD domain-containing protein [Solirubrobacterales bacterium]MBV9806830.1 AzlD domain-containing protein [Solirubrobacterales bacterium]